MNNLYIRKVTREDESIVNEFMKEHEINGEKEVACDGALITGKYYNYYDSFFEWFKEMDRLDRGIVKADEVGCSVFLAFRKEDNHLVGITDIRHNLNPYLEHYRGHIGANIRPSERGKGYGYDITLLAIEEANNLGIDNIIVTCNSKNIAFRKIVEKIFGQPTDMVPLGSAFILRFYKNNVKKIEDNNNIPFKK